MKSGPLWRQRHTTGRASDQGRRAHGVLHNALVHRLWLAGLGLLAGLGCWVNPPPAEGLCRDKNDCREGRQCVRGTCVELGYDGGSALAVTYRFRQWRDGFERPGSTNAFVDGGLDGGVMFIRLPQGMTPRGGYGEIRDDVSQLPLTAQGKVAGRITFVGPDLVVDDASGVRILNLDAPLDAGLGARDFASLVIRAADKRLVLHSQAGLLSATELDAVSTATFVAGGTYFVELGWTLGKEATLRVNDAGVLTVPLSKVSAPLERLYRMRVGFQNYEPGASAPALSANFQSWQVTEGSGDVVADGPP